MTYAIVEVFKTLQGEGMYSGHSAVFVRFAGCNLWSGRDEDRRRDAARNRAECPMWCDTDFLKRATMDREQLMAKIAEQPPADLLVFTGGEPLLQLDGNLVKACNELGFRTCVETNGTVTADPEVLAAIGHVCVSPKQEPRALKLVMQMGRGNWSPLRKFTLEMKLVFPAYDPARYAEMRELFDRSYISPEAETSRRGLSVIVHDVERRAAEFCMNNPGWALSLQTHKHLELP